MKKLILTTLALVLLMSASASATVDCFNTKGSALVPSMYTYYISNTNWRTSLLHITNITDSEVTCKVTVYDGNGNDVSSYSKLLKDSFGAGTNGEVIATGVSTFIIPAQATRVFSFHYDNLNKFVMGHAVIEWTSENKTLRKALIAGFRSRAKSGNNFEAQFPVNNGQPF
ncbi:hypothetical protein [Salidesulfovibrio onnuriiensis]|uniref:hypothetical protein n=1 Tax=Salidesulfovibrio onnuriiensis TaxID=2583823 RepID=UPI0011CC67B8|nr:hypothetical protein [Salidesulfovibrio onnuriiensis]